MNGSGLISRRSFASGLLIASLGSKALAQGFAGLGESASGYAAVIPAGHFHFPLIMARIRNSASSGGT
jgi:hypothetical protein